MRDLNTRSDDGTQLHLQQWGDAERDVLLIPGFAEHAGRYPHVAQALVDAGWRVTLIEPRGHGHSEGRRGHVQDWHRYTEDVQAAAAVIGRPFIIVAHSMGGLIALHTLLEPLTPRPVGLALSDPLLGLPNPPTGAKLLAIRLLSRVLPWISLPNADLDPKALTHDAEIVHAYETDPLVFGTFTPRWGTELMRAMTAVHAHAPQGTLPLHMMIGEADRVCDPQASLGLAERWGGPTTTVKYPDLYHELFNEPQKDEILAEMIAWMDTTWGERNP